MRTWLFKCRPLGFHVNSIICGQVKMILATWLSLRHDSRVFIKHLLALMEKSTIHFYHSVITPLIHQEKTFVDGLVTFNQPLRKPRMANVMDAQKQWLYQKKRKKLWKLFSIMGKRRCMRELTSCTYPGTAFLLPCLKILPCLNCFPNRYRIYSLWSKCEFCKKKKECFLSLFLFFVEILDL